MTVGGSDAIVLAGGSSRRMGGRDKIGVDVAGLSLLERVLLATRDARRVVAVGPRRVTSTPVIWTRESPPGGGPVSAIAAGLAVLGGDADVVAVLAGDLPFAGAAVARLVSALAGGGADGALIVDGDGRDQYLLAAYDAAALRAAVDASDATNGSMRALVAGMRLIRVPAVGREAIDCDTPDELARIRGLAAETPEGAMYG